MGRYTRLTAADYREALLELYARTDGRGATAPALAEYCDVSPNSARHYLQQLVENGDAVERWSLQDPGIRVYAPATAVED